MIYYSTSCNMKAEDFSFHWKPKGTGFEDYVQKLNEDYVQKLK